MFSLCLGVPFEDPFSIFLDKIGSDATMKSHLLRSVCTALLCACFLHLLVSFNILRKAFRDEKNDGAVPSPQQLLTRTKNSYIDASTPLIQASREAHVKSKLVSTNVDKNHAAAVLSSQPLKAKTKVPEINVSNHSAPVSSEHTYVKSKLSSLDVGLPIVDILSMGSIHQTELNMAQQTTMGSHKSVRHFYTATELDDTEDTCNQYVNTSHLKVLSDRCREEERGQYPVLNKISKLFFTYEQLMRKANPVGWLCAQKRPFDGFYNMIKKLYHYQPLYLQQRPSSNEQGAPKVKVNAHLPDYLIVMDNDSWLNLDQILGFFPHHYPPKSRQVVAGCRIMTTRHMFGFLFPYGGYGIMFNRKALERMLQPLNCGNLSTTTTELDNFEKAPDSWAKDEDAHFEEMACWRLSLNGIGERALFRNGMSVADLMHAYVVDQEYRNVREWNDKPGFCMHR